MDNKKKYMSAFKTQFYEFLSDLEIMVPNNVDIKVFINFANTILKMNPKLLIVVWWWYIYKMYYDKIDGGDIEFFFNKDYTYDCRNLADSKFVVDSIDRIKEPIKLANPEEKKICIQYIQNLSTLSNLYHI